MPSTSPPTGCRHPERLVKRSARPNKTDRGNPRPAASWASVSTPPFLEPASIRETVGGVRPDLRASSDWLHPRSRRTASMALPMAGPRCLDPLTSLSKLE